MHLIVDDERLACLRLKDLLIECGLDPAALRFETDPFRALSLLKTEHIKLIFLDIEMPAMSGFEFWQKLKQDNFPGHIICTTAHDQYAIQALREEAIDYLLKPVTKEELQDALIRFYEKSMLPVKDFEKLKAHGLTQRQVEIARRIFEGKTSQQIGEELFLSKHTVDTHRRNILRATGCSNTTELFRLI